MAVSLTTTVNLLFGSKVIVPETGVIMNNEMDGMIYLCQFKITSLTLHRLLNPWLIQFFRIYSFESELYPTW